MRWFSICSGPFNHFPQNLQYIDWPSSTGFALGIGAWSIASPASSSSSSSSSVADVGMLAVSNQVCSASDAGRFWKWERSSQWGLQPSFAGAGRLIGWVLFASIRPGGGALACAVSMTGVCAGPSRSIWLCFLLRRPWRQGGACCNSMVLTDTALPGSVDP